MAPSGVPHQRPWHCGETWVSRQGHLWGQLRCLAVKKNLQKQQAGPLVSLRHSREKRRRKLSSPASWRRGFYLMNMMSWLEHRGSVAFTLWFMELLRPPADSWGLEESSEDSEEFDHAVPLSNISWWRRRFWKWPTIAASLDRWLLLDGERAEHILNYSLNKTEKEMHQWPNFSQIHIGHFIHICG